MLEDKEKEYDIYFDVENSFEFKNLAEKTLEVFIEPLRLRGGGDDLIQQLSQSLYSMQTTRDNMRSAINCFRLEPNIQNLNHHIHQTKQWLEILSMPDKNKEEDIQHFDFKGAVAMKNDDKTECFITVSLRMLLGSKDLRTLIADGMKNSDSNMLRLLRLAHIQDNDDSNLLGALRSSLYPEEKIAHPQQHDASEFIWRILNEMNEILSGEVTLIQHTQAECKRGECTIYPPANLKDPVMNLQIPVEEETEKNQVKMQELLRNYLRPNECTYPCQGCQTKEAPFLERRKVEKWPNHLFISASRRHPHDFEKKILTRVKNAETIECEGQMYKLLDVIIHEGTWNSGHYVSMNMEDARIFNDLWEEKNLTFNEAKKKGSLQIKKNKKCGFNPQGGGGFRQTLFKIHTF